jgi:hypothetical protein
LQGVERVLAEEKSNRFLLIIRGVGELKNKL